MIKNYNIIGVQFLYSQHTLWHAGNIGKKCKTVITQHTLNMF